MKKIKSLLFFHFLWSGFTSLAVAAEQDAHVHGLAHLNVVLEAQQLHMEFNTPAVNVLGFEHSARSAEERRTLAAVDQMLRTADKLFRFPSEAACKLLASDLQSALFMHEDVHEDHASESTMHDHDDAEAHADFNAKYQYVCEQPEKLSFIELEIFRNFAGIEEILAQTITKRGQSASELTATNARLLLP